MIKKLQKMRAEKGFTLAELLVVILIIAILATLAIVFFTGQQETAGENVAEANLRSAYSASQNWYVENNGSYGTTANVVTAIGDDTNLSPVARADAAAMNGANASGSSASSVGVLVDGGVLYLKAGGEVSRNGVIQNDGYTVP